MTEVLEPKGGIEGVSDKAAKAIYSMLKKGRRVFGVPGSYMMHQAGAQEYKEKGVSRKKAKEFMNAEFEVSEFLKGWIKDKPNAVLIESVRIPESDPEPDEIDEEVGIIHGIDTDHVVIMGNEVFLIDTLALPKKKNYSISEEGEILMTRKLFADSEVTLKKDAYNWFDNIEEDDISLTAFVCIKSPETTVERTRNWYIQPFRVVEFERFQEILDKRYEEVSDEDREMINTDLVSQFVVKCIKPYDERTKVITARGLSELR